MKKNKKPRLVISALAVGIILITFSGWPQEGILEYTGTVSEDFDSIQYKNLEYSSVSRWPSGPVQLPFLGGSYQYSEKSGMGGRIFVAGSGDFDGDGYPDMIGLDIENNNRLVLVRNFFEDADKDGEDDDDILFQIDPLEVYDEGFSMGPACISVGDFNQDGLLDFFFMKNGIDSFSYVEFLAVMFINNGTQSDPNFYSYTLSPNLNFTSKFMAAGIYCNWTANHLCSTDLDRDGDVDVLVISQDKIFLVNNPGPENFTINAFDVSELSYNQPTGFTENPGGSCIGAADFDKDGDIDIIGGSAYGYDFLVYYVNDGTGNFTRTDILIPEPTCTGVASMCVADFDKDSHFDLFAGTEANFTGNDVKIWILYNRGVVGEEDPELVLEFQCLNACAPINPASNDLDLGVSLDFDLNGTMDVVLADANSMGIPSGNFLLVTNNEADVYPLSGEARSTNLIPDFNADLYAITKVSVQDVDLGHYGSVNAGLSVEIYVSNNGKDWEFYDVFSEADLRPLSNLEEHTFTHFGTKLYWKALLIAENDSIPGYSAASEETPYIGSITFEYTYVQLKEYSRTSVAASFFNDESQEVKIIIGGSFYFPTWRGQLRAYNISNMVSPNVNYSTIRTITKTNFNEDYGREIVADGVEVYWDAGDLLNARSASSRTIYTALPDGGRLSRINFAAENEPVLEPLLQDVNNDNLGLINFVRGEGRDWKLGDINHSNPVVVGPPDGSFLDKGVGYEAFAQTWEDRAKYVYVGCNDGMLHCFDIETGEEVWAFIPYNLLPKLKNMWAVDDSDQTRYYKRDAYVDGTPTVDDVYMDADGDGDKEWITILICGQGQGQGSTAAGGTTGNFYFALDITDPDDPKPLWEFTDDEMGETWSVPAIGKVVKDEVDTWVCWMGSGYDNVEGKKTQGHVFYAVDLESGLKFWSFYVTEIKTDVKWPNGRNIIRSIPGSPNIVDIDSNGFTDRVYVGDLEGRMWKVDVSTPFVRENSWTAVKIYEDDDNYPIVTKPEIYMAPSMVNPQPRVYFGTGGDDDAPNDGQFAFIAIIDDGSDTIEWFMGDSDELGFGEALSVGDLGLGEKVWADPRIANGIIYFSTLYGSIESVDPVANLAGEGKLYARHLGSVAGSVAGGSAFTDENKNPVESLTLKIKTRSAVTLGETQSGGTGRRQDVYIQEYDSTIQKLEQPTGSVLTIKSWREVYTIKRTP